MQGAPLIFLADVGIPDARQCLTFFGPVLALAALWWFINRIDLFIIRLFPHWEWEREMGWLNLRAYRHADAVLRWIGYLVYAVLGAALYGIVQGAVALQQIDNWSDPQVMGKLALSGPILLVSLGVWLLYFGTALIPKLRDQYDLDELQKFRAEQAILEKEAEQGKRRVKSLSPQKHGNPPSRAKPPRS